MEAKAGTNTNPDQTNMLGMLSTNVRLHCRTKEPQATCKHPKLHTRRPADPTLKAHKQQATDRASDTLGITRTTACRSDGAEHTDCERPKQPSWCWAT